MFKVNKWMLLGLAATLIIASVPLSEVLAKHEGKHHDRWEQKDNKEYSHCDKEKQEDSKDWADRDFRNTPVHTPILQFYATDFADGQTLTLSFSDGVRLETAVRVKNGQLMIPAQPVLKAFQIPFVLYPNGTILEGIANGKQFIFHANKKVMYLDGQQKSMAVAAIATSDQFYVPLKTMAKVLGYSAVTEQENNILTFLR